MRIAKRLAQALLVRFAGMVCPAGAVSAAAYLFRTVRRPAAAFLVRCRVGRLSRAEWLWLRSDRWLRVRGRLPGARVERAPGRPLAEPGNLHLAVLDRGPPPAGSLAARSRRAQRDVHALPNA